MPDHRFYIDSPLKEGELLQFSDEEFHHMCKVMRNQVGDTIEIVNGHGHLAKGTIQAIDKRKAEVVIDQVGQGPKAHRKVILAQALLLMHRLELVIEKGTELGATEFWLFPGERSEKQEISVNQLERLKTITISAMKQSGRLDLPPILIKGPLKGWERPSLPTYFGSLDPQAPSLHREKIPSEVLFLVGPEKGFSESEKTHLPGKGIRLNPNTLRAETAALCALSILVQI